MWGEFRCGEDLGSEVWRSADEEPDFGVSGEGKLRLRARTTAQAAIAQMAAIAASTIPLGETAPGSGTEDFYAHRRAFRADREAVIGLELGVGVRADFAAQINFFVLRSNPFHGSKTPLEMKLIEDGLRIARDFLEVNPAD